MQEHDSISFLSRSHLFTPPCCSWPVSSVKKGDRVAQLILERISMANVVEVDELSETARYVSARRNEGSYLAEL